MREAPVHAGTPLLSAGITLLATALLLGDFIALKAQNLLKAKLKIR